MHTVAFLTVRPSDSCLEARPPGSVAVKPATTLVRAMDSITMAAYPGPPNTGINSNHMGHMGHMGGISTLSNFDDIGRHGSIGTTPDYEGLGHVGQTHRLRIKPYRLEVRQQPATARVAVGKEKGTSFSC